MAGRPPAPRLRGRPGAAAHAPTVAAVTPNAVAPSIPLPDCYLPRSFVCGGRGVGARGRLRFFRLPFFSVPSFASRRFVSGFAFVCFCFCFVLFFFFVCLCCACAWVRRPFACGRGAHACLGRSVLVCGLGRVAGVRQGLEVAWFVVVAGDDVVDVGCAHGACGVVPPGCPPLYLSGGGWWGGVRVEARAFVVRFREDLFPEFVPVRWQALTPVGCGPWHVCRVPGGVWVVGCPVGGGGPGSGVGFLGGVGFRGRGVWWVAVFGWWVPVAWSGGGVTCAGPLPLDPSLTPRPGRSVCCGSWFGSSLCRVMVPVGWWVSCGLQFFSEGVGWSCGWLVLLAVFWSDCSQPGVVVAVLVGCSGSAACLLVVSRGCGLCGLCSCRGVVLLLVVLFPLGGPTWTVGLFAAPLFLPPQYTTKLPRPSDPVGELTR